LRDYLMDPEVSIDVRREIPGVLVRIGSPAAQLSLMESVLQPDAALRFRIIRALNKLREAHPNLTLDRQAVEMLLAAEILGHYRSYQILGTLAGGAPSEESAFVGLKQSMDQELERIFGLMALLFPSEDLQSAYFGLQSDNPTLRSNSIEFLDNVLKPELRQLLLPVLDSQVGIDARVRLANRLVGAPVETKEEAVEALLFSEDPFLQACGAHAIGTFRMTALEPALNRWLDARDPVLRETARDAKERLGEEMPAELDREPVEAGEEWRPTDAMGVG
jgi:hypothetical protein